MTVDDLEPDEEKLDRRLDGIEDGLVDVIERLEVLAARRAQSGSSERP